MSDMAGQWSDLCPIRIEDCGRIVDLFRQVVLSDWSAVRVPPLTSSRVEPQCVLIRSWLDPVPKIAVLRYYLPVYAQPGWGNGNSWKRAVQCRASACKSTWKRNRQQLPWRAPATRLLPWCPHDQHFGRHQLHHHLHYQPHHHNNLLLTLKANCPL